MKVKIKKLVPEAVIPTYSTQGDAGMDLVAVSAVPNAAMMGNRSMYTYGTGLAFEIPEGYVGLIFPRSSVFRKEMLLTNSVGVIDSGYRGEVKANFYGSAHNHYRVGDRIAQMIIIPYPTIEFEEVDTLSETNRGSGGFGSTGGL